MSSLENAKDRLRSEDCFVTRPRKLVLKFLFEKEATPRTPKQIHRNLPEQDIDRSSVYRSINLFLELGILDQVQLGDGIKRVELSSEYGGSHHHHLVCKDCGEIVEFEECGIQNVRRLAEVKHRFQVQDHQMEFFGVCSSCQQEVA